MYLSPISKKKIRNLYESRSRIRYDTISAYIKCMVRFRQKKDGHPGLLFAVAFSTSPLKLLILIKRNLTGRKISTSSIKFVFFGLIVKTRWPPWPLIGWAIFDISSETAERNSTKLDRKQDLSVLYQVCVFRADWKTRWPTQPLIVWDIFDFSSETNDRNSTKLDRKQDLNVLFQVCVFRADRENKIVAHAPDWLKHFQLLLWNNWTEFNETWQEARSQRPLTSLFLFGPIRKAAPSLIVNFSSETAERNSTELDRKQ